MSNGFQKPATVREARDAARETIRNDFMDALGEYIDARIRYANADHEYASTHEVDATGERLEGVLDRVLANVG